MFGVTRKAIGLVNKVVNIGSRTTADDDDPFRYFGVSGKCCPCGYYKGSEASITALKELKQQTKFPIPVVPIADIIPPVMQTRSAGCEDYLITDEDKKTKAKTRSKLKPRLTLHNNKWEIKDFSKYVYFAHCDFRKRKKYKRRKNEFYKTAKKNQGVRRQFAFHSLPCSGIEKALTYDPFHAFLNFVKRIVDVLNGDSGIDVGAIRQSVMEGRMPFMNTALKLGKSDEEVAADALAAKQQANAGEIMVPKSKKQKTSKKESDETILNKFQKGIPWLLSNPDQYMSDAIVNCIWIPTGLKGDFRVKNPITNNTHLKGHDKILFMTTYVNVALMNSSLPHEYKNLMGLISDVLSDLQSPIVFLDSLHTAGYDISGVDDMKKRVNEMLILWEGMFHDSEQYFATHEFLDIVHSLERLGPARSWWAYGGERFMKTIKDACPDGGDTPLQTMYNYYAFKENLRKHSYEIDKSKLDNKGLYRDSFIKINTSHPKPVAVWNMWLRNALFSSLYKYMQCSEKTDKYKTSPFYRLYRSYLLITPAKFQVYYQYNYMRDENSFCHWLKAVVEAEFKPAENLFSTLVTKDVDPKDLDEDYIEQHYYDIDEERPVVFEVDKGAAEYLMNYKPRKYFSDDIIAQGTSFTCRGQEFAETSAPITKYSRYGETPWLTTNVPANNLKHTWSSAKENHWCSIYWWYTSNDNSICKKSIFAQLNMVFRFEMEDDPFLHMLPIANVTARNTAMKKSTDKIHLPYIKIYEESPVVILPEVLTPLFERGIEEVTSHRVHKRTVKAVESSQQQRRSKKSSSNDPLPAPPVVAEVTNRSIRHTSYNHDVQFVCLNYFQSTNVALLGMDEFQKPMLVDAGRIESRRHLDQHSIAEFNEIEELHLINLSPHRRNVYTTHVDSKHVEQFYL